MRTALLALAVLATGCEQKKPAAAATPPSATAEQACLGRYTLAHGYNEYGDPKDTAYAGGSPLFDEASGKSTPLADYLYARHPDARAACQVKDAG